MFNILFLHFFVVYTWLYLVLCYSIVFLLQKVKSFSLRIYFLKAYINTNVHESEDSYFHLIYNIKVQDY